MVTFLQRVSQPGDESYSHSIFKNLRVTDDRVLVLSNPDVNQASVKVREIERPKGLFGTSWVFHTLPGGGSQTSAKSNQPQVFNFTPHTPGGALI